MFLSVGVVEEGRGRGGNKEEPRGGKGGGRSSARRRGRGNGKRLQGVGRKTGQKHQNGHYIPKLLRL